MTPAAQLDAEIAAVCVVVFAPAEVLAGVVISRAVTKFARWWVSR